MKCQLAHVLLGWAASCSLRRIGHSYSAVNDLQKLAVIQQVDFDNMF